MTRPPDPQDPFAPPSPVPPSAAPPPSWEQPQWQHQQQWGQQPWGPPYGYGQKTNVVAILSLVFAFLCFPAGLVLGIVALTQLRHSQESGRGLAVAGVAVSGTVTVLVAVFLALGFSGALDDYDGEGRVAQVGSTVIGACLTGMQGEGGTSALVECTQEHEEEVYAVKHVEADAWPGTDSLASEADDFCHAEFKGYVGTGWFDSEFDYDWYRPDAAEWSVGERRLVCVVTGHVDEGEGSIAHSER